LGLSAYAVRLLGEVHVLSWSVEAGETIEDRQPIGHVEAAKATSDLYAPLAGSVVQTNAEVVARPKLINSNLYDDGWLISVVADRPELLSPEKYVSHLETCWPLAQRLLKNQAGEGGREP
jgi:glycine cleavage system H protein